MVPVRLDAGLLGFEELAEVGWVQCWASAAKIRGK